MRLQTIALIFVGLLAAGGLWLWNRDEGSSQTSLSTKPADAPKRTIRSVRRMSGIPRPADGEGSGDLPPEDLKDFEIFPAEHRPDAINAALDDMPEWLGGGYADAAPELLGIDCAAPPCLVGLRYEDNGMPQPERLAEFVNGYRAEVERRLGFDMTVVDMQEDTNGRQYIWMYAIPDALPGDDPLRADLLEDAADRNNKRMQPLMPVPEVAEPGAGEGPTAPPQSPTGTPPDPGR